MTWKNQSLKQYHALVLAPQAVTADVNSSAVDCKDLMSLAFLVLVDAFTFTSVNKIGLKLQESDDGSVWADATELYEPTKELVAAADASKTHLVEYRGGKRYARLVLDVSGTVNVEVAVAAISQQTELKPPQ